MPRHLRQVGLFALMVNAALCVAGPAVLASEENADRQTQTALTLDARPDRGAVKYARYCSQCHGLKAQGDTERAAPALAGQRFAYLVRQLANFGSAERDSGAMYHVVSSKTFSEPQTWDDVAAFLNRLAPRKADADAGNGTEVGRGRVIFREQCAACHQRDAGGDKEGFVPSLRNQHYSYLANQLHRLADGHRHNVDPEIVRLIRSLEDNDVTAVANYLSHLRGRGTPRQRMLSNGVVVD